MDARGESQRIEEAARSTLVTEDFTCKVVSPCIVQHETKAQMTPYWHEISPTYASEKFEE